MGRSLASAPNDSATATARSTAGRSPEITNRPGALMFVSATLSSVSPRIDSSWASVQMTLAMPRAGPPEEMICSAARMRAATTSRAVSISQTPAAVRAEISPKLWPIITSGRIPRPSSTRNMPSSAANRAVCAPTRVPRRFAMAGSSGSP